MTNLRLDMDYVKIVSGYCVGFFGAIAALILCFLYGSRMFGSLAILFACLAPIALMTSTILGGVYAIDIQWSKRAFFCLAVFILVGALLMGLLSAFVPSSMDDPGLQIAGSTPGEILDRASLGLWLGAGTGALFGLIALRFGAENFLTPRYSSAEENHRKE
ncbi:MAG: hypothetical protein ABIY70_07995 [Capsulimonas sp.]|uniref:hypothetical protein n=1 Tax=Capsulimonas sp. TaxID=2494211 RepID=UPI003264A0EE